jgi:hypothetical protein
MSVFGILIPIGGFFLALAAPPLALATLFMTLSVLLYRAATVISCRRVGI